MSDPAPIIGTDDPDDLTGGSGNDQIYGLGGDDILSGLEGDDLLVGGPGNDTMYGGTGNDTFIVDSAGDQVIEYDRDGEGIDTIRTSLSTYTPPSYVEYLVYEGTGDFTGIGTGSTRRITGGAGNDTLTLDPDVWTGELLGGAGNDTLTGGNGADWLDGGAGSDTMAGGDGNDTYVVDDVGDVVTEQAFSGTDYVLTSLASYALPANVEQLKFTGTGAFTGEGNSSSNKITGGTGDDTLSGGDGNDTIYGQAGRDIIDGGAGNDALYGGSGNDVLDGGTGGEHLEGGTGDDVYLVDSAYDGVYEYSDGGNDLVRASVATYTLRQEVENLTYTGSGDFTGTGNKLANVLKAGTGNDALYGGDGDDTLYGLAGNDMLDGGSGNDTMIGGSGNDTYVVDATGDVVTEYSGGGTDTVQTTLTSFALGAEVENLTYTFAFPSTGAAFTGTGNSLANTISGGNWNDSLYGGGGNDTLYGLDGNDLLDGGAGNDAMIGGAGDDLYYVDSIGDTVTESAGGGTDSVRTTLGAYTLGTYVENLTYTGTVAFTGTGTGADNVLKGGTGNDTLYGGSGNDTLYGLSGNDTLDGGAGNDAMIGGSGDDLYFVDSLGDTTVEYAGGGTDSVRTSLTAFTLAAEVENLTYTGTGSFTGTGNALDNMLKGGAANDVLSSGAGDDTIYGLAGDDIIDSGSGNDVRIGGSGNDTYIIDYVGGSIVEYAGGGTDTVKTSLSTYSLAAELENLTYTGSGDFTGNGNGLVNTLKGGTRNDILRGGAGNDTLYGLAGNDTLDGGAGDDTMIGGSGDDAYVVNAAGDVVTEYFGGGTDTVTSYLSSYTLGSDVENLTLVGAGLSGTGNGLANVIRGGTGNDTITGLGGADTLFGDAGADTFVYKATSDSGASSFDTIGDFSAAAGDVIDLTAIDANSVGGSANDAFVYVGAAEFSGTAGELRLANGQLQGDTNGDRIADLSIALTGVTSLSGSNLRL